MPWRTSVALAVVLGACRHASPAPVPPREEPPPPPAPAEVLSPDAGSVVVITEPLSPAAPPEPTRTCLVLSVGGSKGMAHLGAIEALKAARVKIDCVYGNSMGAVVGSLYASAPNDDTLSRYRQLIARYVEETAAIKTGSAAVERLLTGVRRAIAGQGGWFAILSNVSSALSEMLFSERFDNDRFRRVLDAHLEHARLERLLTPFATSYQTVKGQGLVLGVVKAGNVAEAVSRSANNPFIFKGTSLEHLDPGSDRVAAVPVEDACETFGTARLITINVAGSPAHYNPQLQCPVVEVVLAVEDTPPEAITGQGAAFEKVYLAGKQATEAALQKLKLASLRQREGVE